MKISLSTFWDRLVGSSLCELVELFGAKVPWPDVAKQAPYRISFAGVIQTIRQFIPILPMLPTKKQKQQFIKAFMKILAADIVPIPKEPRREPRAIKRRPKSYQLLTKPRHKFREIPHREKYRKEVDS